MKKQVISLTRNEIQSGLNRQDAAEGLISQLPKDHDGRNTWLMTYGVKKEAVAFRVKKNLKFLKHEQAAESRQQQLTRISESGEVS